MRVRAINHGLLRHPRIHRRAFRLSTSAALLNVLVWDSAPSRVVRGSVYVGSRSLFLGMNAGDPLKPFL